MASNDRAEVTNQTTDVMAQKSLKYDCLESLAQNGHFGRIYVHFYFFIVFQWRGHDLLSDFGQFVMGHGQTPHSKFGIFRSKLLLLMRVKVDMQALQLTFSGDRT